MKKINVMGIDYEIIQLTPEAVMKVYAESEHFVDMTKLIGENGKNFAGLCDAQNCKIYINIDLPPEKKKKILIHEIIEAIDQESCTDFDHTEMQVITNALVISGIINVEELLKIEPEDIEISIDNNPA